MIGLVWKDLLILRKTLKTYILFLAFYLLLAVLDIFPVSTITAVTQLIIMMLPLSASPMMIRPSGTAMPSPSPLAAGLW